MGFLTTVFGTTAPVPEVPPPPPAEPVVDRWADIASALARTWPDPAWRTWAGMVLVAALFLSSVGLAGAMAHGNGARRPGASALLRAGGPAEAAMVAPLVASGAPAAASAVKVPAPTVLPRSLPTGKGMWIWKPDRTEGGKPEAIVRKAVDAGLSHVYVRTGSSWDGFDGGPFLSDLLPVAHKAGLRVYGWDFPRFIDWKADVQRSLAAVAYRTPDGHRLDGFAPDIETPSEGTRITAAAARAFGEGLRQGVGPDYPLIAVVPRPSPQRAWFPYADVVAGYNAIAPMVYWLNREPGSDVAGAIQFLSKFGKPVIPVGQAYDGSAEGGRKGVPPRAELQRFISVAAAHGAPGVSFWAWQHANGEAWSAIHDAPEFAGTGLERAVGALKARKSG